MPALVPIPWQPTLFLTPDTLAYLVAASKRVGRNLFLAGSDAAHRTHARQDYLYEGYLKKLAGVAGYEDFNVASNPDTGQRNHMRGAAFDLLDTSATVQAACRAVGLTRDPVESWHWNNPHWASMPIIPTNTAAAGGGAILIPEEDMSTPLTDADAQTVVKTQIILPAPWKQASVAETLAGTRARAEDTYLIVSALTAAVSALGAAQGLKPEELSNLIAAKVDAALSDDFAALTANVPTYTPSELQQIASAVADEQARRLGKQ